ncbi:hypothetical protein B0H17DRAFT_1071085 [Mycena rosella]|uniref:Uncharacterized protein n=1 Tax=Mycena rosella TaxID=1033263 RepID=A0AAD7DA38_MYCRO|nr:hypothetical protein B0H17DRAFT_1071085 [Mycena rosella]
MPRPRRAPPPWGCTPRRGWGSCGTRTSSSSSSRAAPPRRRLPRSSIPEAWRPGSTPARSRTRSQVLASIRARWSVGSTRTISLRASRR